MLRNSRMVTINIVLTEHNRAVSLFLSIPSLAITLGKFSCNLVFENCGSKNTKDSMFQDEYSELSSQIIVFSIKACGCLFF